MPSLSLLAGASGTSKPSGGGGAASGAAAGAEEGGGGGGGADSVFVNGLLDLHDRARSLVQVSQEGTNGYIKWVQVGERCPMGRVGALQFDTGDLATNSLVAPEACCLISVRLCSSTAEPIRQPHSVPKGE